MVLVTPFVVQLLELTTGAKMVTAFVKNVSYSCILDRSDGGDVFGFISVDQHLGTNHCHLLRMQPGGGSAVHSAINNAFQMLAAEEKYVFWCQHLAVSSTSTARGSSLASALFRDRLPVLPSRDASVLRLPFPHSSSTLLHPSS